MYESLKFVVSDTICAGVSPFSSPLFGRFCPRFLDGFFVTVELLILASLIGFVLAVFLVLARSSNRALIFSSAALFVYCFRGTPLLVQLWIIYFGIGSLGPDNLGVLWVFFKSPWLVGLFVLILNTSAYVSEILRGGLVNVDKGQMEAAMSIGMSWLQAMRRILLPQALRLAWPAYGNELILLMKGSALLSTITVLDLMGQTRTIFARNFDLSTYVYAAILYLILAGIISGFIFVVERRFARSSSH